MQRAVAHAHRVPYAIKHAIPGVFVQALRLVDQRNVIRSDFILISGDTVRTPLIPIGTSR